MKLHRILIAAAAVAAATTASASPVGMVGDGVIDTSYVPSTLTRAEVRADLQIYRESGLAALQIGEAPEFNTPAALQAKAKYAALRASPRYAALVQQFAERSGETVAQATQR